MLFTSFIWYDFCKAWRTFHVVDLNLPVLWWCSSVILWPHYERSLNSTHRPTHLDMLRQVSLHFNFHSNHCESETQPVYWAVIINWLSLINLGLNNVETDLKETCKRADLYSIHSEINWPWNSLFRQSWKIPRMFNVNTLKTTTLTTSQQHPDFLSGSKSDFFQAKLFYILFLVCSVVIGWRNCLSSYQTLYQVVIIEIFRLWGDISNIKLAISTHNTSNR